MSVVSSDAGRGDAMEEEEEFSAACGCEETGDADERQQSDASSDVGSASSEDSDNSESAERETVAEDLVEPPKKKLKRWVSDSLNPVGMVSTAPAVAKGGCDADITCELPGCGKSCKDCALLLGLIFIG